MNPQILKCPYCESANIQHQPNGENDQEFYCADCDATFAWIMGVLHIRELIDHLRELERLINADIEQLDIYFDKSK